MIKTRYSLKKIQTFVKRYVNGNWGFPFVAGFILLLFAAAVLLAVGRESVAELTANVAYFTLVIGVVLQIVCFGKNRLKNGVVFDGSG